MMAKYGNVRCSTPWEMKADCLARYGHASSYGCQEVCLRNDVKGVNPPKNLVIDFYVHLIHPKNINKNNEQTYEEIKRISTFHFKWNNNGMKQGKIYRQNFLNLACFYFPTCSLVYRFSSWKIAWCNTLLLYEGGLSQYNMPTCRKISNISSNCIFHTRRRKKQRHLTNRNGKRNNLKSLSSSTYIILVQCLNLCFFILFVKCFSESICPSEGPPQFFSFLLLKFNG